MKDEQGRAYYGGNGTAAAGNEMVGVSGNQTIEEMSEGKTADQDQRKTVGGSEFCMNPRIHAELMQRCKIFLLYIY
jgi:hypothetical protein